MELKTLKKLRYFAFTVLLLASLGSVVVSIIISVKYFDAKVPWQCILGAAWTMASLIMAIYSMVGIDTTQHMNEIPKKRKYYSTNGKRKIFKYKEEYIKLNDLNNFLVNTKSCDKIYILSKDNTYSVLKVYMEYNRFAQQQYRHDTKAFILDGTTYKNIYDLSNFLSDNYLFNDEDICVIGYKHDAPTFGRYGLSSVFFGHLSPNHLKKRIDENNY
ncbi:MAG: hypothetical protein K2K13_06455 [Clostridiales bacterium]|nr:hypothetical protein [Clostridiales bacterium]